MVGAGLPFTAMSEGERQSSLLGAECVDLEIEADASLLFLLSITSLPDYLIHSALSALI
jgi:hypothetical protein